MSRARPSGPQMVLNCKTEYYMRNQIRFALMAAAVLFLSVISACYSQEYDTNSANCFTIIVGKNASADGSVFLCHNEDDAGELLVDMHKVPQDPPDTLVQINDSTFIRGNGRNGYLWVEIPGQRYADGFLNQFGVAVCSDGAQSREDSGSGKICYYLRKAIAGGARSAREGVEIAGRLIEEFGYSYSGRAYAIADPNEAWVLEVVMGTHWVARRVPDDGIVVIPNYYVITDVDLSDTVNFLGSTDLVKYAEQRGWYNGKTGVQFNFRSAYGSPERLNADWNIDRRWAAFNYFSAKQYSTSDDFPFSIKPKRRVELAELVHIMRNHYEGTELAASSSLSGDPHSNRILTICSPLNQYSFVAQLRNWMPADVGNILWFSPRRPCVHQYIPVYSGITSIPVAFESEGFEKARADHFTRGRDIREKFPDQASWIFYDYAAAVDSNYREAISAIATERDSVQDALLKNQPVFEQNVLSVYRRDEGEGGRILTNYTSECAMKMVTDASKGLTELRRSK